MINVWSGTGRLTSSSNSVPHSPNQTLLPQRDTLLFPSFFASSWFRHCSDVFVFLSNYNYGRKHIVAKWPIIPPSHVSAAYILRRRTWWPPEMSCVSHCCFNVFNLISPEPFTGQKALALVRPFSQNITFFPSVSKHLEKLSVRCSFSERLPFKSSSTK